MNAVSPAEIAPFVGARGTRVAGGAPLERTAPDPGPVPPPFPRYKSLLRAAPIAGFTGINGSGKTLYAVSEVLRHMSLGREVYSTVPISSPWGDSKPLLSHRHFLELRDCTVLLDEVSATFNARDTMGLPTDVVLRLQTLRHYGLRVIWTAPAWGFADVALRKVTQVSVNVTGLGRAVGGSEWEWPRPLLSVAWAMDCRGVAPDAKPEKVVGRRVSRLKRLPAFGMYDSEAEIVSLVAHRQDRVCVDCGGSKRPEPCSPERHRSLGIGVR